MQEQIDEVTSSVSEKNSVATQYTLSAAKQPPMNP